MFLFHLQLHHLWNKVGQGIEEKWLQALSEFNTDSPQVSIMVGALCKHLKSQGKLTLFNNYKVSNSHFFLFILCLFNSIFIGVLILGKKYRGFHQKFYQY